MKPTGIRELYDLFILAVLQSPRLAALVCAFLNNPVSAICGTCSIIVTGVKPPD